MTVSDPRWPALATKRFREAAASTKNPSPKMTSCVLGVGSNARIRRSRTSWLSWVYVV